MTLRFLPKALLGYSLAAGLAAVALYFICDVRWIFFPFQKSATESVIAWAVRHLPEYPLLYRPLTDPPMVFPYSPLYAYLAYGASSLIGGVFAGGRLVSLALYIVTAGLLFKIWRLEAVPRPYAGLFTLLLFTVSLLNGHALYMQIDIPSMAFNFAGIYFALRWQKRAFRPAWDLVAAVLLLGAAVFTKQTVVFGAGAFVCYLLYGRNYKYALIFSLYLAGAILAAAAVWQGLTGGNFLRHIYLIHTAGYSMKVFWLSWYHYPQPEALWLIYSLAAGLTVLGVCRKRLGYAEFYFLTALVSTLLVSKRGSNHNYFIELTFASLLLIGMRFPEYADFRKNAWLGALLWLFVVSRVTAYDVDKLAHYAVRNAGYRHAIVTGLEVAERLGSIRGKVISEDFSFLLHNGMPVYYMPYEHAQMAYLGVWDQSNLIGSIRSQSFACIVTQTNFAKIKQNQRFTPEFVSAVRQAYKPYGVLHGNIFYVPNYYPDRRS